MTGAPSPGPVGDAERYRTLLSINNAIISNLTRETLFHAIADSLRQVVPFERTAVFLHDVQRDVLRLFMLEASLPTSYFVVGFEIPSTESHVGWVFHHRRPLLRRDLAQEQEYPAEARALADGVRSFVIVPLIARGQCTGTLAVASTRVGQYSDRDVSFLQEVASQVALAIENMTARPHGAARAAHARVRAGAGPLGAAPPGLVAVSMNPGGTRDVTLSPREDPGRC
jgi:formate hydrogenlyase transcriptional activator